MSATLAPAGKPTSKADFMLRRIDWSPVEALGLERRWIGADLFLNLDTDRRAVVSMKTCGISEHYAMLLVRILNKREGEVDHKGFGFSEHLAERIDKRSDFPDQPFEVISYCGWDWHIAVPATTTPLIEAVASYVATFV